MRLTKSAQTLFRISNLYLLNILPLLAIGCVKSQEEMLQARAIRGDVHAMCELANAYESPTGGGGVVREPNTNQAIELYRKAAQMGYAPAMYEISQVLTRSITNEERVIWLKKGAELGNEACIIEITNCYRFGKYNLPKDTGAAIYWELKRGELFLKRDNKSPVETRKSLSEWEQRYRRDRQYDGPIRPLP